MIVVGSVVSWIAVAVFCLVPKKLTPFGIIFLFFCDTVCELGTFSVLNVNLKLIQLSPGVENALTDLMFRLIELPLLLVTTTNLLLHSNNFVKWGGVTAIILFTLVVQSLLAWKGMITFHDWNILYSGIYMCVFTAFSRAMAWIIMRTSPKEAL